jgi:hypothetical protein
MRGPSLLCRGVAPFLWWSDYNAHARFATTISREKSGRCILLNAMIGSRTLSNDCKPGLSNRGRTRFLRRQGCGADRRTYSECWDAAPVRPISPYIGVGSPVDQSMWVDNLTLATSGIP